jgi:predicted ATPase
MQPRAPAVCQDHKVVASTDVEHSSRRWQGLLAGTVLPPEQLREQPDASWLVAHSAAPLLPLAALLAVPAVALFVGRARAHRADFTLEGQDASPLTQLVTQRDGLALALELAAARLDALSLSTLVRRLEAAVGWSYDLLSEPQQRLVRCLGVFVGR